MPSRITSLVDSAIKNLDLTLTLEIPLGQSESCSSSPSISLELDGTPLPTLGPQPDILPAFTKSSLTGSALSLPTTGDPETSEVP
jgi:hypothetical protein